MVQGEMNDMYINICTNNGSEKFLTKKDTANRIYYAHEMARKNTYFELGLHSGLAAGSVLPVFVFFVLESAILIAVLKTRSSTSA